MIRAQQKISASGTLLDEAVWLWGYSIRFEAAGGALTYHIVNQAPAGLPQI